MTGTAFGHLRRARNRSSRTPSTGYGVFDGAAGASARGRRVSGSAPPATRLWRHRGRTGSDHQLVDGRDFSIRVSILILPVFGRSTSSRAKVARRRSRRQPHWRGSPHSVCGSRVTRAFVRCCSASTTMLSGRRFRGAREFRKYDRAMMGTTFCRRSWEWPIRGRIASGGGCRRKAVTSKSRDTSIVHTGTYRDREYTGWSDLGSSPDIHLRKPAAVMSASVAGQFAGHRGARQRSSSGGPPSWVGRGATRRYQGSIIVRSAFPMTRSRCWLSFAPLTRNHARASEGRSSGCLTGWRGPIPVFAPAKWVAQRPVGGLLGPPRAGPRRRAGGHWRTVWAVFQPPVRRVP